MANVQIKATDKLNIEKKPRVYFTCHHDDCESCLDRLSKDIFSTHNCAIYYTPDMTEEFDDMETDLGRYNLFVVPVTLNLLMKPSRAIEKDIPFAIKQGIPILPIMMEYGLDELYSQNKNFGDMQYLDANANDDTAVKYSEKLEKYLDSVLISDELAERVRAAFDAYIFLSYRKKDRKYANELMCIIHSNPECRDIAIWFDEFLTPGESFKENINKILSDSKMFALLVTPNLLEEPDGKPNFVMGQEYPAALELEMEILPAEMEKTDKKALDEKFERLPACIDPRNEEEFKNRLVDSVKRFALTPNDSPEHNFLIGLAYLEGIDVEIDHNRGLELITSAAEKGLFEAVEKLYKYYAHRDLKKAQVWAEKIVEYNEEKYGKEDLRTENATLNLARLYTGGEQTDKQRELIKTVYDQRLKRLGLDNKYTVFAYIALLRHELFSNPDYRYPYNKEACAKFCKEYQEAYVLICKVFGEEDLVTIQFLSEFAMVQKRVDYKKAHEIKTKEYELYCKILGTEHPKTLDALFKIGEYLKEDKGDILHYENVYLKEREILGYAHPRVLSHLLRLAHMMGLAKEYDKAIKYFEELYKQRRVLFGEEHSSTEHALKYVKKYKQRKAQQENKQ